MLACQNGRTFLYDVMSQHELTTIRIVECMKMLSTGIFTGGKIPSNLEVCFRARQADRRAIQAQSYIYSRWSYNIMMQVRIWKMDMTSIQIAESSLFTEWSG